ncbi:MAG: hypothetical protein E7596_03400 [Ruminococcaceae bacterium]|nr:hypothetical protein [Oscillospiraceae bacterium]
MDNFLQVKRTVIDLGTEKEYRFFQISDMHMACLDEESSQTDINDHKRFHKQWDSLKRDFAKDAGELCDERYDVEPNIIFEKLAKHALDIKADALILSGDIFDRVTESNLRYMKKFMGDYPLPVIYCPGNHAWINEAGEHLNQYERFNGIIKNPAIDSFDFGELEIVTVDNGTKQITNEQIRFLKDKLSGDKKIALVVHAPLNLGEFGERLAEKMSPYFLLGVNGDCENAFLFNRLVKENDDKIICVLAGHIHAFYEGNVTENLKQYTTSSGLIGAGREIIIK